MSRATGEIRPVTIDATEPSSWLAQVATDWGKSTFEPYVETGKALISSFAYVTIAAFCALVLLYVLRLILRRVRINHYSK